MVAMQITKYGCSGTFRAFALKEPNGSRGAEDPFPGGHSPVSIHNGGTFQRSDLKRGQSFF